MFVKLGLASPGLWDLTIPALLPSTVRVTLNPGPVMVTKTGKTKPLPLEAQNAFKELLRDLYAESPMKLAFELIERVSL